MAEPRYEVFIRVPIPRAGFIDPPQVDWSSVKDDALWKILSGAAQAEIDWIKVAERFDVPVDFLLQQVAFLTERHASQVRAQVRKATAAAKGGSSAPSPIPGAEASGTAQQRASSVQSMNRDSPLPRVDGSGMVQPLQSSGRPLVPRNESTNTIVLGNMKPSSPRLGKGSARPIEPNTRQRLSSLPTGSGLMTPSSGTPPPMKSNAPVERQQTPSPGPAESESTTSSDDDSSPAQSRIIRRPPRYQQPNSSNAGFRRTDDDEEESEPAFGLHNDASGQASAPNLAATLRGNERIMRRQATSEKRAPPKSQAHNSNTSDDSASSAAMVSRPSTARQQKPPGPLSPRRTAELSGRSPAGKSKGTSREGSDGTPSMGSSFSDLEDTSVTQSALEEALASHINNGASSRFSISQAFRSRYNPSTK